MWKKWHPISCNHHLSKHHWWCYPESDVYTSVGWHNHKKVTKSNRDQPEANRWLYKVPRYWVSSSKPLVGSVSCLWWSFMVTFCTPNPAPKLVTACGATADPSTVLHQVVSGASRTRENLRSSQRVVLLAWSLCDVHNWCESCISCTTRKTPATGQRAALENIAGGYPMQTVATPCRP